MRCPMVRKRWRCGCFEGRGFVRGNCSWVLGWWFLLGLIAVFHGLLGGLGWWRGGGRESCSLQVLIGRVGAWKVLLLGNCCGE